jgi:hypothetical protein
MEMFNQLLTERLSKTIAIAAERGDQYGDTLRNCQWIIQLAVEKELKGVRSCPEKARALSIAGLCDIKYYRFAGGWRMDNIVDGINYLAVLPDLVQFAKDAETSYRLMDKREIFDHFKVSEVEEPFQEPL